MQRCIQLYQKAKQTHHSDTPLPFNQTENERCLFLSPTQRKFGGCPKVRCASISITMISMEHLYHDEQSGSVDCSSSTGLAGRANRDEAAHERRTRMFCCCRRWASSFLLLGVWLALVLGPGWAMRTEHLDAQTPVEHRSKQLWTAAVAPSIICM